MRFLSTASTELTSSGRPLRECFRCSGVVAGRAVLILLCLLAFALHAGEATPEQALLPTVSRVPSAPQYILTEFDKNFRGAAMECGMGLTPAEKMNEALEKFCLSFKMPIYNARRLEETAKYLGVKRMFRIVVQDFSVYSRQMREAVPARGTTFYYGRLQVTLQTINASGFVAEARGFTVKMDSTRMRYTENGNNWSAEILGIEMVREAVSRMVTALEAAAF